MISSGGRQFDVCTGERREPPRRRKSMCCGDCQKELHLSSLALGNAYVCRLAAATTDVRVRLAASEHCDVVVHAASGRRARISAQVRCVGPKQAAPARPVLAIDSWSAHSSQSVDREADASAKRSGSDEVVQSTFASHGLARAYRRMAATTLAAGKTLGKGKNAIDARARLSREQ